MPFLSKPERRRYVPGCDSVVDPDEIVMARLGMIIVYVW
jgi:hypothetical protein